MNNESSTNWIDKILRFFEIVSYIFLIIPFGSMALYFFTSSLKGDYFFFFPIAMFLFFPAGIFAFLMQSLRTMRKKPVNNFNNIIYGFSIFTIVIGCLAWMAIYVVTGG